MIQIAVRMRPRSYPLIGLTGQNPHLSILDWCNFNTDFYQLHTSKPSDLHSDETAFLRTRKKVGMILRKKVRVGTDSAFFVFKCNHPRRGSIEDVMQKCGCLPIAPLVFHGGWLKVTGLCADESRIPAMLTRLKKFGELEVESKVTMPVASLRENFMIPTGAILADLTEKQAKSLLIAVEHGYYQVPRKTKFLDISNSIKVPRTTYEEHVRKAESKIINSVVPYLSLFFDHHGETNFSPKTNRRPRTEEMAIRA